MRWQVARRRWPQQRTTKSHERRSNDANDKRVAVLFKTGFPAELYPMYSMTTEPNRNTFIHFHVNFVSALFFCVCVRYCCSLCWQLGPNSLDLVHKKKKLNVHFFFIYLFDFFLLEMGCAVLRICTIGVRYQPVTSAEMVFNLAEFNAILT